MAITIELCFRLYRDGQLQEVVRHKELLEISSSLGDDVQAAVDELIEEHDGYRYEGHSVMDYDGDYDHPENFDNLNDFGEYVEKCEEHGEAYQLRYSDVGDHDFEDEYNGCWNNEEEFVQNLIEDLYTIPKWVDGYIDWEAMTRDVMMDYSSYDGKDGTHIFRN